MIRKIYRLSIQVDEIHVEHDDDDEVVSSMPTEGMPRQILYLNADLQTREGLSAAIAGGRETVDEELGYRDLADDDEEVDGL